jgi:hypothetical protein
VNEQVEIVVVETRENLAHAKSRTRDQRRGIRDHMLVENARYSEY